MTTSDSDNVSNSGQPGDKKPLPVMFCQTAEGGGSSKQLARGATPSTPDGCALERSLPPRKPGARQAAAKQRRKEKRRLTELLFFRCTPEDKELIESNAGKTGLDKSSYLRVQATGRPVMRACRRVRADWQELQHCMGVIGRAGNVLNQLILELRRGGGTESFARHALMELGGAARAIMAALGGE